MPYKTALGPARGPSRVALAGLCPGRLAHLPWMSRLSAQPWSGTPPSLATPPLNSWVVRGDPVQLRERCPESRRLGLGVICGLWTLALRGRVSHVGLIRACLVQKGHGSLFHTWERKVLG